MGKSHNRRKYVYGRGFADVFASIGNTISKYATPDNLNLVKNIGSTAASLVTAGSQINSAVNEIKIIKKRKDTQANRITELDNKIKSLVDQ